MSDTKLSDISSSGPYTFHSPKIVDICIPCFACSQLTKPDQKGSGKYKAVKAICNEDNLSRYFHIRCWNSNAPGSTGDNYRWNRRLDADYSKKQSAIVSPGM